MFPKESTENILREIKKKEYTALPQGQAQYKFSTYILNQFMPSSWRG